MYVYNELQFEHRFMHVECRSIRAVDANINFPQNQDLNKLEGLPENVTKKDLEQPAKALGGLKSGAITYSDLYELLCKKAGLSCEIIRGIVKGANWTSAADMEEFKSSWNKVKIDGDWCLVDSQWGARHISNSDEENDISYSWL